MTRVRKNYPSPFRKSRTPKWVKAALKESDIKIATEKLKQAYLRDAKTNGKVNPGMKKAKSVRLKNFTGVVKLNPNRTVTVKGKGRKAKRKR